MVRSPRSEKGGLKKGAWTPEEDQKLLAWIEQNGHGSWQTLPAKAGLQKCGKSCRLRWTNYLRPDIKRGKFSLQEEQTIIQLHALLGNKWSAIANHLPKRTDNEIKKYWNTHPKKRLDKMGIDPVTHKPKTDAFDPTTGTGNSKTAANLSHIPQLQFRPSNNNIASKGETINEENEWKCMEQAKETLMGSSVTVHGRGTYDSTTDNNNKWVMDTFMEANLNVNGINIVNVLSDIMVYNISIDHHNLSSMAEENAASHGSIIYLDQDQRYCWNSLLDLVDAPAAASGSQVL